MTRRFPTFAIITLACLVAVSTASADSLDGYDRYDAFAARMKSLGKKNGVRIRSLGKTAGGREILVATVGVGDVDDKPAIVIMGATHASHVYASDVAVKLIERLAADDEAMTKLRERVTFYVVPRPSPDATEHVFDAIRSDRATNDRPRDDDNDGVTDEDGPNDLNGDGWITMMRIAEPGGEWIAHPDDPRVMIKADAAKKNERGRWKLMPEGKDDDGDGDIDEDAPGGVAFDRNWSFAFPAFKEGAGPHAVSEPETAAIADWLFARTNVAAVVSLSPRDNLVHPWKPGKDGREKTNLQGEDAGDYERVVEAYKKLRDGKGAPGSANAAGSFVDWAYFHYGRWSFGARGWWVPDVKPEEPKKEESDATPDDADKKEPEDKRGGDERDLLRWLEANEIDGFVAWQKVDHPDFPDREVEVGGFKPLVTENPPVAELEGIAETHTNFVTELAGMLPRVGISELRVKAVGDGVLRIEAVVINDGDLATMPRMGAINNIPIPLNWTLDIGENAKLLLGERRGQIERLASRGGQAKLTWLVRTDARSVKLTVTSPSVGTTRAEATIE